MRCGAEKTGFGWKDAKGQTTIETVLLILVFFLMVFVIVEWSRAWWNKNSLNNAVRIGARMAAVRADLLGVGRAVPASDSQNCSTATDGIDDPNVDIPARVIVEKVCLSYGVPRGATTLVIISATNDNLISGLNEGDTVTVRVEAFFNPAVRGLSDWTAGAVPGANLKLISQASMRYEL